MLIINRCTLDKFSSIMINKVIVLEVFTFQNNFYLKIYKNYIYIYILVSTLAHQNNKKIQKKLI